MRLSATMAGVFGVALLTVPGLALAADGTLTVTIGGEGFDGPPKFAVLFDGQPLGEDSVTSAIDTASAGRFADAADKAKYVQTFTFKIPDAVFRPEADIAIKLTNEAHGAVGSKNDRELYVASVDVNGTKLPAGKLSMRSAVGVEPTAMLGDYLVVSTTGVEGIAAAPAGGWPKADVPVASAPPPSSAMSSRPGGPKPVTPAVDIAAAPTPKPVAALKPPANESASVSTPSADEPKPVAAEMASAAPSPLDAPVPATPEPATKVAEVAADTRAAAGSGDTVVDAADAGNPDPEAGADCGVNKQFQVTGFNENSNDLTPRARKALDAVVQAIGTQKCVVHLTGYSSIEGDHAHNALFSIERSQNALRYLAAQGVKFRRYSANGVGETRQFGPDPNANRRVVVTVSP